MVRSFGAKLLLTVFFGLLVFGGSANGQKVATFPGVTTEVKSPNGRYILRNSDDEKQEPAHSLTLIDTASNVEAKIYSYGRHVQVLWSPTSRSFIVNDFEGSDSERSVLFTMPWTKQGIDLRKRLIDFLTVHHQAKSVVENHHVYFSVQRWLSGDQVLCKVSGYGDVNPNGFTKLFMYRIDGGFRPVS